MSRQDPTPYYEEFDAVRLLCPKCRIAQPVRKRLLLVLPDGELFEYFCAQCNTSVGKKKDQSLPKDLSRILESQ